MTNLIKFIILLFALSAIYSCNNNRETASINKVERSENKQQIISNKPIRYSSYIPKDSNISNGIIVILDPHSKPELIMDSLHNYARINHVALLGVKDVKNGISNYIDIINRDLNQFIAANKINRAKLYLIGFSGAARMAERFAYSRKTDGLIMCGAGMGRKNQLPFPTVLIAGIKDFNFLEQYYDCNDRLTTNKNLVAYNFIGGHSWPPMINITIGMDFLFLRKKGGNDSLSLYYEKLSEEFMQSKDYYFAFKSMEVSYKIKDIRSDDEIKNKMILLRKNSKIKNYFKRTNLYLEEEVGRYRKLTADIDIHDIKWWNNQINYIKSRSNKNDIISSSSYARTNAYLGLVTFSKINIALAEGATANILNKYISIYELLEPQSPYVHFFKAVIAYRGGNDTQAMAEMQIAYKNSFNDDVLLRNNFTADFINLLNK